MAMRSQGRFVADDELVKMMQSIDVDGNNEINFQEFLVFMKKRAAEEEGGNKLQDAFDTFDVDGSGYISQGEFKTMLQQFGQSVSDLDIDTLMFDFDTDGDRRISFEEFKTMMSSS